MAESKKKKTGQQEPKRRKNVGEEAERDIEQERDETLRTAGGSNDDEDVEGEDEDEDLDEDDEA